MLCYRANVKANQQYSAIHGTESLMPYLVLILLAAILVLARTLAICWACQRSSIALHRGMLDKLIRAPMSFVEQNSAGNARLQHSGLTFATKVTQLFL